MVKIFLCPPSHIPSKSYLYIVPLLGHLMNTQGNPITIYIFYQESSSKELQIELYKSRDLSYEKYKYKLPPFTNPYVKLIVTSDTHHMDPIQI